MENIDSTKLPRHIAVIMDGNGRWAKKKGAMRVFGHQNAVRAVREIVESCAELQIGYLTLFAFSTENWQRPESEVNALMKLLISTIKKETPTLIKNNIKLSSIGDKHNLPKKCQVELDEAIEQTSQNTGLNLVLALSYSGRWDLLNAIKEIVEESGKKNIKAEEINETFLKNYLSTKNIPDPELLIRTSGEYRISNFLLWEIAYTEIFVTDVLWPDFRKKHLYEAITDYQKRERRFGKTSEQIQQ